MNRRVADDAALPNLIFTGFELGLDERDDMSAGPNQVFKRR